MLGDRRITKPCEAGFASEAFAESCSKSKFKVLNLTAESVLLVVALGLLVLVEILTT